MINKLVENQTFEKVDYSNQGLSAQKFDNCTFKSCQFTSTNLSGITFMECTFEDCDFSLVQNKDTALKDVKFINSKLVGFNFSHCNDFLLSVSFDNCNLDYASFYELKLQKTTFKGSNLKKVDFGSADLNGSIFDGCDLRDTIFDFTNLENVDFYTSQGFIINPDNNKIKNARFSKKGILGLLTKYDIRIEE